MVPGLASVRLPVDFQMDRLSGMLWLLSQIDDLEQLHRQQFSSSVLNTLYAITFFGVLYFVIRMGVTSGIRDADRAKEKRQAKSMQSQASGGTRS
jgi:hypothetical protein